MQVLDLVLDDLRIAETTLIDYVCPRFLDHWVCREPFLEQLFVLTKVDAVVEVHPRKHEVKDVHV